MREFLIGLTGAGASLVIAAVGILIVRWYRGRGDYATKLAEAKVTVSAEDRKARQEQAEAERKARQEEEEAGRRERQEREKSERQRRRDLISEQQEVIENLKSERDEYRQQIHGLRNDFQKVTVDLAVCKTELAACRDDHREQKEWNAALLEALEGAGLRVLVPGGSKVHAVPQLPPPPQRQSPPEGET